MKKNTSSTQNPSPSCSKEDGVADKDMPHIFAVPAIPNPTSKMKILQLSPIKNLPKGKTKNVIKLNTASKISNLKVLPHNLQNAKVLKIPTQVATAQQTQANKVLVLSPSQTLPLLIKMNTLKTGTPVPNTSTAKTSPKKHSLTKIAEKKPEQSKSSVTTKKNPEKDREAESNWKKQTSKVAPEVIKEVKHLINKKNTTGYKREKKSDVKETKKRKMTNNKTNTKNDMENKESKATAENLYVADGFRADVGMLLDKCSQVFNLSFAKFTDIWKELNFARIFHGKLSGSELAEFTEEAIHIAKSFMVSKNFNVEENIAGLFLVYALLNLQPFPGFVPLRLVPADVPRILELEKMARAQRRHDVLFVLGSVLVRGPVHAHVLSREVAIEAPIKKYYDGTVQISDNIDSVFTRNADCVHQLKELTHLEQRYHALKKRLADAAGGADGIRALSTQPAADLLEKYRAHIPRGQHLVNVEPDTKNSAEKNADDRMDMIKAIKDKAMKGTVDPMRHLTGIEDRLQEPSSSSDSEGEPSSPRKRNSGNKPGFYALALQKLFSSYDPNEAVVEPSQNEMPVLDDTDERDTELETNKRSKKTKGSPNKTSKGTAKSPKRKAPTRTPNDDSNNNSQTVTQRGSPNKRKRKHNNDNDDKNKQGPTQIDHNCIIIDSDSDTESIEVDVPEEQPKFEKPKVLKIYTRKNQQKQKIPENSIINNINSSSESSSNTMPNGETQTKNTKKTDNNEESRDIQELSHEEEISYLKSVIEEIEGTIDQDPATLITAGVNNEDQHTSQSIPKEIPVEQEFEVSPKKSKKFDTKEKCLRKVKKELDEPASEVGNKSKAKNKIELSTNEAIAFTKPSEMSSSESVASTTSSDSPKAGSAKRQSKGQTLVPKIVDVKSLSDLKSENRDNINSEEYLKKMAESKDTTKFVTKKKKTTFKRLGITQVASLPEESIGGGIVRSVKRSKRRK